MTRWIRALAILVGVAVGCASAKPAASPAEYYRSSEYQDRVLLQQSLFRSDQAVLTNEDIAKILSSRIELPKKAHLTVLRLGASSETLGWAFLSGPANPFESLSQNPRVSRLSWLPSLLMPEKLSVPLLREAAARFQADLLLVYRTPCQRFESSHVFAKDTGRAYCVVEGLLLDIRTGVIPFSAATTREVKTTQSSSDTSFYETMKKAEAASTAEALTEFARQVSTFLASSP